MNDDRSNRSDRRSLKARGSSLQPPNRFERIHIEEDLEQLEQNDDLIDGCPKPPTAYFVDDSKSIVTQNKSPDIPFRYSVNPYRGCAHGCSYCYARPGHEFLGFNAGLDFESKIVVKRHAPRLLRAFLAKDSWVPEPITFSGVTDCYQPVERKLRLTRGCLEVALACRQPISVITKNALVLRDLDIIGPLARQGLIHVFLSITTLDPQLAREMEPRTSIPAARLRAVRELAGAGVPTGVMVAPIIPGLNDSEAAGILEAASLAGARTAGYVMLRLPLTVEPVFRDWLERTRPDQTDKVLGRVRKTRQGQLYDASWGQRMSGTGEIAQQIASMFRVFKQRCGLNNSLTPLRCDLFEPPLPESGQRRLF